MKRRLRSRDVPAVGLAVTTAALAAACGSQPAYVPPPQPVAQYSTIQDCATRNAFGQPVRVDDSWCAVGHPGAFPVYSSIYGDGFYSPPWGSPLIGFSTVRPYGYSPTTVIVNSNRYGGTVNRYGSGSGVTGARLASGGSVRAQAAPPAASSVSSQRGATTAGTTSSTGSSTVSRGGLGVPSASSSSSSSGSSSSGASAGG